MARHSAPQRVWDIADELLLIARRLPEHNEYTIVTESLSEELLVLLLSAELSLHSSLCSERARVSRDNLSDLFCILPIQNIDVCCKSALMGMLRNGTVAAVSATKASSIEIWRAPI